MNVVFISLFCCRRRPRPHKASPKTSIHPVDRPVQGGLGGRSMDTGGLRQQRSSSSGVDINLEKPRRQEDSTLHYTSNYFDWWALACCGQEVKGTNRLVMTGFWRMGTFRLLTTWSRYSTAQPWRASSMFCWILYDAPFTELMMNRLSLAACYRARRISEL